VAKEKLWYPEPELMKENDLTIDKDHNCSSSASKK